MIRMTSEQQALVGVIARSEMQEVWLRALESCVNLGVPLNDAILLLAEEMQGHYDLVSDARQRKEIRRAWREMLDGLRLNSTIAGGN